jgi:hypothetical protein
MHINGIQIAVNGINGMMIQHHSLAGMMIGVMVIAPLSPLSMLWSINGFVLQSAYSFRWFSISNPIRTKQFSTDTTFLSK